MVVFEDISENKHRLWNLTGNYAGTTESEAGAGREFGEDP